MSEIAVGRGLPAHSAGRVLEDGPSHRGIVVGLFLIQMSSHLPPSPQVVVGEALWTHQNMTVQ